MPAFPGRSFNPKRTEQIVGGPNPFAKKGPAKKGKGKKPPPFAKKGKTKAKGKGKGAMPFPPEAMKMAGAMRAAPFLKK